MNRREFIKKIDLSKPIDFSELDQHLDKFVKKDKKTGRAIKIDPFDREFSRKIEEYFKQ